MTFASSQMAKEISCNVKVYIASKGTSKSAGELSWTEDLGGTGIGFEQKIGVAAEPIPLPADVGVPKVVYIQNLDPTNYVEIDNVTGMIGWPQKILPGTAALLRPGSATLHGRANGGEVRVWIVAG